jgi:1,5-anhydro-D-fructose reductase (1,5-anhydro-D-mannitol-forming)
MPSTFRILVIGYGLIGKQRANAVVRLSYRKPVALAGTVDPYVSPARPGDSTPHYARIEDVPADSFDAAIVAVPHDNAKQVVLSLARLEKPVLVEKPLGINAEEACEMHDALNPLRLPSFVGYNYRFLPTVRALFSAVAIGALGNLRSIDMFLGHGGHPHSADGWKLRPERAGGGVLLDPGVHLIDLLLCVAPTLECRHVTAARGFWKTQIDEDLVAIFTDRNLIATVRVSHIRWISTFRLEFLGEEGYALIEGRGGNYGPQVVRLGKRWGWNDGSGRSQRETEEVYDFGIEDHSLEEELEAVVDRWLRTDVRDDQPRPATIADGLAVARLCDHMYQMQRP